MAGRVTYYTLTLFMALNIAAMMLTAVGIEGIPITPFNQTQAEEGYDPEALVKSYNWSEILFYNIGAGIGFIWNLNAPLIESFQGTLQALGMPEVIVNPIKLFWRFIWVGFFIEFLSGRDFMP